MRVDTVFISIDAADFDAQSDWWSRLIGRPWDRAPMPSCHEWDLIDGVLFQVLDSDKNHGAAVVTLHVRDLDAESARLADQGIAVPVPVRIEGFDSLRYAEFADPEGNRVGLLDGS